MGHNLKYLEGSADTDKLQAATESTWRELQQDETLRAELIALDPAFAAISFEGRSPFDIKPASAGFAITGTAILIGLGAWGTQVAAGVAQEMILDAWRKVILPRIKDRLGSDAVGPETDE